MSHLSIAFCAVQLHLFRRPRYIGVVGRPFHISACSTVARHAALSVKTPPASLTKVIALISMGDAVPFKIRLVAKYSCAALALIHLGILVSVQRRLL